MTCFARLNARQWGRHVGIVAATVAACTSDGGTARDRVSDLAAPAASPRWKVGARLFEPEGPGLITYVGLDIDPPDPKPGHAVTLTHYWSVVRAPVSDAKVFVHVDAGGRRIAKGDHPPLYGRLNTSQWKPQDTWADRHVLHLPDAIPPGTEVLVGLSNGESRWSVEAVAGQQDGQDRLRAATLSPARASAPDNLPVVEIPRISTTIEPDGVLDEAEWSKAPVLSFSDSLGRSKPLAYATRLRLLYDDRYLYVGFEAMDRDITERYARRDDPIYEHEAVELFIMPHVRAPALGRYVELQASPGGVVFDASFDGPRRGMNKAYDALQTVGTTIDGTLNDPRPDRRWVSEWRVPFTGIRGVRAAPRPGDEWRMNAFRIEKFRRGDDRGAEYSAWSPPGVGDFHHVARFGRMRFGPPLGPTAADEATAP